MSINTEYLQKYIEIANKSHLVQDLYDKNNFSTKINNVYSLANKFIKNIPQIRMDNLNEVKQNINENIHTFNGSFNKKTYNILGYMLFYELFNNLKILTGIVVEDDNNIYILFNFGTTDIFIDDISLDLLYRLLFRKQKKTISEYKEDNYYAYLEKYVINNNFIGYIPRIVPPAAPSAPAGPVAPSEPVALSVGLVSIFSPMWENVKKIIWTNSEREKLSGIDLTTNTKKIILCGHSMGAVVSLNLGYYIFKNDPELFSRIIVIGTGAYLSLSKEKFEDEEFQNAHNQIFMYYSSMKLTETTYTIDCAFANLKELKLPYKHVYLILSSETSATMEYGTVGYDYDEKDKNNKLYILLSNGQKIVPEYFNPPRTVIQNLYFGLQATLNDTKCMHNLKDNYISKCAILFNYKLEGGSSNKQKRKTKRRKNKKTKYRKTRREDDIGGGHRGFLSRQQRRLPYERIRTCYL